MCNSQNQAVACALVNLRQKANHALSSRLLSFIGWPASVLFSNLEERFIMKIYTVYYEDSYYEDRIKKILS